jgi:hypothetical protein
MQPSALGNAGQKRSTKKELHMATPAKNTLHGLKPLTDPLGIYLNDHLAGATAGLELFRRAASAAPPRHRTSLERLTTEVDGDRRSLIDIMTALDVPVRHYKIAAGWLGEKVGRAKPNGRLMGRAPLSALLEAEALLLGVRGKAAGWQALRALALIDSRISHTQLDELIASADRQAEELEQIRQEIATEVLIAG